MFILSDETGTPQGSLANCLFPILVFKCVLLFCLYPVIYTIPSMYFHIISPCYLSEKKKKKEIPMFNFYKYLL